MLELPSQCPKSITCGHDGNIIDGDVDVAFVVDFVLCILPMMVLPLFVVLSFGDIIGFSKTIGIRYMFMLFLVL
jgi:hypothetical protein